MPMDVLHADMRGNSHYAGRPQHLLRMRPTIATNRLLHLGVDNRGKASMMTVASNLPSTVSAGGIATALGPLPEKNFVTDINSMLRRRVPQDRVNIMDNWDPSRGDDEREEIGGQMEEFYRDIRAQTRANNTQHIMVRTALHSNEWFRAEGDVSATGGYHAALLSAGVANQQANANAIIPERDVNIDPSEHGLISRNRENVFPITCTDMNNSREKMVAKKSDRDMLRERTAKRFADTIVNLHNLGPHLAFINSTDATNDVLSLMSMSFVEQLDVLWENYFSRHAIHLLTTTVLGTWWLDMMKMPKDPMTIAMVGLTESTVVPVSAADIVTMFLSAKTLAQHRIVADYLLKIFVKFMILGMDTVENMERKITAHLANNSVARNAVVKIMGTIGPQFLAKHNALALYTKLFLEFPANAKDLNTRADSLFVAVRATRNKPSASFLLPDDDIPAYPENILTNSLFTPAENRRFKPPPYIRHADFTDEDVTIIAARSRGLLFVWSAFEQPEEHDENATEDALVAKNAARIGITMADQLMTQFRKISTQRIEEQAKNGRMVNEDARRLTDTYLLYSDVLEDFRHAEKAYLKWLVRSEIWKRTVLLYFRTVYPFVFTRVFLSMENAAEIKAKLVERNVGLKRILPTLNNIGTVGSKVNAESESEKAVFETMLDPSEDILVEVFLCALRGLYGRVSSTGAFSGAAMPPLHEMRHFETPAREEAMRAHMRTSNAKEPGYEIIGRDLSMFVARALHAREIFVRLAPFEEEVDTFSSESPTVGGEDHLACMAVAATVQCSRESTPWSTLLTDASGRQIFTRKAADVNVQLFDKLCTAETFEDRFADAVSMHNAAAFAVMEHWDSTEEYLEAQMQAVAHFLKHLTVLSQAVTSVTVSSIIPNRITPRCLKLLEEALGKVQGSHHEVLGPPAIPSPDRKYSKEIRVQDRFSHLAQTTTRSTPRQAWSGIVSRAISSDRVMTARAAGKAPTLAPMQRLSSSSGSRPSRTVAFKSMERHSPQPRQQQQQSFHFNMSASEVDDSGIAEEEEEDFFSDAI